jgi:hypothetical protein
MTNAQRNLIFALAKKHDWEKDKLHAHVERLTGSASLKNSALSYDEASRVINSLLPKELTIPGMATQKQRDFMDGLARELGWKTPDGRADAARVSRFVKERFHIDRMEWLDAATASKVIEGLKAMKARLKEDNNGVHTETAACAERNGQ